MKVTMKMTKQELISINREMMDDLLNNGLLGNLDIDEISEIIDIKRLMYDFENDNDVFNKLVDDQGKMLELMNKGSIKRIDNNIHIEVDWSMVDAFNSSLRVASLLLGEFSTNESEFRNSTAFKINTTGIKHELGNLFDNLFLGIDAKNMVEVTNLYMESVRDYYDPELYDEIRGLLDDSEGEIVKHYSDYIEMFSSLFSTPNNEEELA